MSLFSHLNQFLGLGLARDKARANRQPAVAASRDLRAGRRSRPAAGLHGPEEETFRYTPLLGLCAECPALVREQPFAGKRVVLVLHFLRNLIPFIAAAERLGLEPSSTTVFYKHKYGYPHRNKVHAWLARCGCKDIRSDEQIEAFRAELETTHDRRTPLLIVEDGAYFSPALAASGSWLSRSLVGVVEQTTNGIDRLKDAVGPCPRLEFPVLSIPASQLKRLLEPPFIGRATVQALQQLLTGLSLAGQEIAIIGHGSIGAEVARALRNQGASRIRVFDRSAVRRAAARSHGYSHAASAVEAARGCYLLLGTTGRTSITREVLEALPDGAYVASCSSRTVEVDLEALATMSLGVTPEWRAGDRPIGSRHRLATGKSLVLLADGTPLNFWGTEGMPDQVGDVVMALILLSAAELAAGRYDEAGLNEAAVNEIEVAYCLSEAYLDCWYGEGHPNRLG